MVVSNLVNTMYCRDAGKKLRTANQVKWRKGITTASAAPFGYQFDPDKKGAFIIDPPAAKIVRRIFDLAILGLGTREIAMIQALLADWESGNKSRRMILSYDQRIMTGQYPVADLMGYRHTKDGQLVIEPEEAKTVRFIFLAFIQGYNYDQIAAVLTQKKRSTLRGRQEWNGMMVANIMKNERRWGDLEARKSMMRDAKDQKMDLIICASISRFARNFSDCMTQIAALKTIQFIQALLEANELAVGKDHQFKGRYEADKNAVIISLEKDEQSALSPQKCTT